MHMQRWRLDPALCDPFHGLSVGGSCDAGEGRHLIYCIVSRLKKAMAVLAVACCSFSSLPLSHYQ